MGDLKQVVDVHANTKPYDDRISKSAALAQKRLVLNDRKFTQPLGRMKNSADEFTKSMEAANARVLAFGASVGVINAIGLAFKSLISETIKVQKTLADINIVLDTSNS